MSDPLDIQRGVKRMKVYTTYPESLREALAAGSVSLVFNVPEMNHGYGVGAPMEARGRRVLCGVTPHGIVVIHPRIPKYMHFSMMLTHVRVLSERHKELSA